MRSRVLLPLLVLALVALAPASAATVNISILGSGFNPSAVTIAVGDTVTWTNADNQNQQVESTDAPFTSPILKPGEAFSFTFRTAGRYTFRNANRRNLRGSVTVQGPTGTQTVTQTASRALVVYGGTVTLSGAISSKASGETVTVYAKPFGQQQFAAVGSAISSQNGAWTFLVKPRLFTTYESRWKPAGGAVVSSSQAAVKVRPQVAFRVKASSGRTVTFFTKVRTVRSLGGKFLYLQRKNNFGQWVTMRKVTLGSTSSATFKQRMPAGRSRVRLFMPQKQVGPGYLAGISRVLTLTR